MVYGEKKVVSVEPNTTETAIGMKDVITIVQEACNDVKRRIRAKYVDSGKVSENVFCCYFKAIEEEILNRVRGKHGDEQTLYATLKAFIPHLDREDYQKNHRSRLEYLLKLVGRKVSLKLRHE
jgi:broad-specificity NMP kinase